MEMFKKKVKLNSNIFSIEIPEEFINKEVDIIIRTSEKKPEEYLLLDEIKIDTREWKFNREEIYE